MDPTRFHIEDGQLHIGDRPIPWGQTTKADFPCAGTDEFYYWRTAEVPFESGDKLRITWSDGSYSDNYTRQTPEGEVGLFVESPISVELSILYAGETDWGDIVQGWVSVPQALLIINTLAAPRGGMFTGKTRSFLP